MRTSITRRRRRRPRSVLPGRSEAASTFGSDTDYAILRYGKQEGIYGFSGAVHYQITPATLLTAEALHGLGSQQDQIANTLTQSSLDPFGIDRRSVRSADGVCEPAFGIQNDVFRSKSYRINLTTTIGVNRCLCSGLTIGELPSPV